MSASMESPEDMANDSMRLSSARQLASTRYRVALERAKQLRDGGIALRCVWSASRIRSRPR